MDPTPHPAYIKVTIGSEPRLLQILRGVVRRLAQGSGFSSSDEEGLAMAIGEAAANVICHTYKNRPGAKLALEIRGFPDRLEFTLDDSGPKVRPEIIRPRPLDDVRPGGLGTFFIKCFMDKIFYDEEFVGGNRLKLIKYLPGRQSSSDEGSG
jgi:anti-sigma regulatory factor (Ser/Thr protein kinase)